MGAKNRRSASPRVTAMVHDVLREASEPLTVRQIQTKVGVSTGQVWLALQVMRDVGTVEHVNGFRLKEIT